MDTNEQHVGAQAADDRRDPPPYTVFVNGDQMVIDQRFLTFDEVCRLAFPDGPFGENIVYTVTYSYRHGGDHQLEKGQRALIREGMVFDVGNADRS